MTDRAAHSENASEICKQNPLAQLSVALGSPEDAGGGKEAVFQICLVYDLCSVKGWHLGQG